MENAEITQEPITQEQKPEYDSNPFTLSFKGFGLMVDYAKGVLITIIVLGLLSLVGNVISTIIDTASPSSSTLGASTTGSTNSGIIATIGIFIIGVIIIGVIIGLVISAIYKGFVAAGAVAASEKRNITVGEAVSEMGARFGTLIGAEFRAALRIFGGYVLFVIPGIRAQLRYQSTPYIIMRDKNISASDAIEKSKLLYKNHLMEVFGINTVGAIIPIVGPALTASGIAMSVQQITAYSEAKLETPKTHWLNYLGIIIGILFFVLMLIVMGAIFAALVNTTK